jgi:DNA-binding NarL/FixJ family response regulator
LNGQIRILIADDHPLLTTGLKMTLEQWDEFLVVGVASNGLQAVELCEKTKPHIVIMDMQMPRMSGREAIEQIKSNIPGVRILAFTTFDDADTVSGAIAAGCDGFLLKVIAPEKLRASLNSIAGGINVYDEDAMSRLRQSMRKKSDIDFSGRELTVLRYVCEGMTNAEIADKMGLRSGTVKNMISLLLSKTNCVSRSQLARYATENHLIS